MWLILQASFTSYLSKIQEHNQTSEFFWFISLFTLKNILSNYRLSHNKAVFSYLQLSIFNKQQGEFFYLLHKIQAIIFLLNLHNPLFRIVNLDFSDYH